MVGRPTIERQSVSDIFVNMYLDGSGGFIQVVGVGRLFMRADLNVGRVGPGHQPGHRLGVSATVHRWALLERTEVAMGCWVITTGSASVMG